MDGYKEIRAITRVGGRVVVRGEDDRFYVSFNTGSRIRTIELCGVKSFNEAKKAWVNDKLDNLKYTLKYDDIVLACYMYIGEDVIVHISRDGDVIELGSEHHKLPTVLNIYEQELYLFKKFSREAYDMIIKV